jgi:predicted transcriptional regulator YdeE
MQNIATFKLIGLQLNGKSTNENGQSGVDCGNLWQQFEKGNFAEKVPGKLSDEIIAVYFDYEGDHTKPFSYFIGCKVNMDTEAPEGMSSLIIPSDFYIQFNAKGTMPDCVAGCWERIWDSEMNRAYTYDFEVYDERSKDWSNAEVDIFISNKA